MSFLARRPRTDGCASNVRGAPQKSIEKKAPPKRGKD